MFNHSFLRVATAAVGALVLSTLSVAAAVGPAETPAAYASVEQSVQAHA